MKNQVVTPNPSVVQESCPGKLSKKGMMAAVQGVALATFVPGKRKDSLNLKDNKNYVYVNKDL